MKKFNEWLKEYFEKENIFYSIEEIDQMILEFTNHLILDGKHYGDCTNQNVSCKICDFEDLLSRYYNYTIEIIYNK